MIYTFSLLIIIILVSSFLVRKLLKQGEKAEQEQREIEEKMAKYNNTEDSSSQK
ncbi:hypothetical protein MM300_14790 [Evansella sp. LMS18]|uniref:hypothetical protein n=1 Tax=Evansella sp. LMS18 TaxID=2924033 RepID=UPI0020CFE920|nr:hypothetical protein [Evansella sp. LMS18]UTR09162.1 hypothetical protein MM300_14790 [Evansella sp. LMS18]